MTTPEAACARVQLADLESGIRRKISFRYCLSTVYVLLYTLDSVKLSILRGGKRLHEGKALLSVPGL